MRHRKSHSKSSQIDPPAVVDVSTQTADFAKFNISSCVDHLLTGDETTINEPASQPTDAQLEENYKQLLAHREQQIDTDDPVLKLLLEKRKEVLEDLELLDQALLHFDP